MKENLNLIDDFGSEIGIYEIACNGDHFIRFIRFIMDGKWEGISSHVLSGNIDEDSLIHFGLIQ